MSREAGLVLRKTFIALLVLPAATLVALAFFAYPSADDFCFLYKAARLGFADAQLEWYATWTGRYTASALISALMLAGTSWYPLGPLLVLATWFISIWLLLAAAAGDAFPRRSVLLAAGAGFVLHGAFAPSPNGAFFWASGAFTYQVGNTLLLLMLAVNVCYTRVTALRESAPSLPIPVASNVLLGLALAGTNETVALLAMILFAIGAGFARRLATRATVPWLAGLLAVSLGFLVVFLAPGNEARMQHFPEARNFTVALLRTAVHTLGFIVRQSANPALWICVALVAAPLWDRLGDGARDWLVRRRGWMVLLVLWLAMLAACFFPANYAMGAGAPPRAVNIAFVVFLLGWFPVTTVLAERFFSGRHILLTGPQARPLLVLVLGLTLAGASQMREMYKDLGHGPGFRKHMLQREASMREAAANGIRNLAVPPLQEKPEHLYFLDIERDTEDFKNQCVAGVFDLDSVRTIDAKTKR